MTAIYGIDMLACAASSAIDYFKARQAPFAGAAEQADTLPGRNEEAYFSKLPAARHDAAQVAFISSTRLPSISLFSHIHDGLISTIEVDDTFIGHIASRHWLRFRREAHDTSCFLCLYFRHRPAAAGAIKEFASKSHCWPPSRAQLRLK